MLLMTERFLNDFCPKDLMIFLCFRVAEKSATQLRCRFFCNTDAPGTNSTNSYVMPCNANATPKNLQRNCVADAQNLRNTPTRLA
jgi:hypothetical protein